MLYTHNPRSPMHHLRRALAGILGLLLLAAHRTAPEPSHEDPRDRRSAGVAVIWIALLAAVLFGFVSLGTEVVLALQTQRQMQATADSAAVAAAIALSRGDRTWTQEGYSIAGKAGFTSSEHDCASPLDDVVSIQSPPCDGPHAGDNQFVEALIRKPFLLWLARPLGYEGPFVLHGRAVVSTEAAWACSLILDPSSRSALSVSGTASVTFNDCAVIVDSTASPAATVNGGGILNCAHLFVGGTQNSVNSALCPYTEHSQAAADPYLAVNPPFVSSASAIAALPVATRSTVGNTETITPVGATNSNGLKPVLLLGGIPLKTSHATAWNFCPGIYVINGAASGGSGNFDLTSTGSSLQLLSPSAPACAGDTGTGIAFVLTSSGAASQIPNVKSQPGSIFGSTTQPLQGIDQTQSTASGTTTNTRLPPNTLFWQNPNAPSGGPNTSKFYGTTILSGILYFPHQPLNLEGHATTASPCFQVVAWDLTIGGNVNLNIDGCAFSTKTAIPGRNFLVE